MSAKDNADFLMQYAQAHGITGKKELANFMGQMQVESGGFKSMNEQLGYSGARLFEVFEGRNGMNSRADAESIAAGGPEAVANAIYGGAFGKRRLGNTEPGDGWAFHGRGYVQLTGRENYEKVVSGTGLDVIQHPELAADRDNAAKIAVFYWNSRVIKEGHATDVDAACVDINGGTNGLSERRAAATAWEAALDRGYTPGGTEPLPGLPVGGKTPADSLRHVQELLNERGYRGSAGTPLDEDGRMGPQTRRAIEAFQRDNGLQVDGIAGRNTLRALEQPQAHDVPPTTPTGWRLDDPAHAGNVLYKQALAGVERLDVAQGRTSDDVSRQFAGAVAVEAHAQGLSRVDHVVLGDNGAKAWAVEGDLNSPFKKLAEIDTLHAVNAPLEQSSQRWESLQAQRVDAAQPSPVVQQTHDQQPAMHR
jgi:putative chitinase